MKYIFNIYIIISYIIQDGLTAIHLAAKEGHVSVLEVLKGKVPWNAPSVKSGLTALHIAAHTGQIDFVREMLPTVPATIRSEISAGVALGDDVSFRLSLLKFGFRS